MLGRLPNAATTSSSSCEAGPTPPTLWSSTHASARRPLRHDGRGTLHGLVTKRRLIPITPEPTSPVPVPKLWEAVSGERPGRFTGRAAAEPDLAAAPQLCAEHRGRVRGWHLR